jgi:hypothetical protein
MVSSIDLVISHHRIFIAFLLSATNESGSQGLLHSIITSKSFHEIFLTKLTISLTEVQIQVHKLK